MKPFPDAYGREPALTKAAAIKQLKKQFSHKSVEKELWDVFSLYIRARDNWTCFTCGRSKRRDPDTVFQAGHLFTRGKAAIKYDERQVFCQCAGCNFRHNSDPDIYRERFIKVFGQARYDTIYQMRNAPCKRTVADMRLMIDHYKQKYEALKGQPCRMKPT